MKNFSYFLFVIFAFVCIQAQEEKQTEKNSNWVQTLTKNSEQFANLAKAANLLTSGKARECNQIVYKACELDKKLPPAEFILAVMYIESKNGDIGRKLLEQAGQKNELFPGTYILLGNIALNQQRNIEAKLLYTKANDVLSRVSWVKEQNKAFKEQIYTGLAAIAERRGDWEKVAENFGSLLALKKDGLLRQRLAIAKFRSGKKNLVFQELERAKKEEKSIEEPEVTMGKLYTEANDEKEATKWMKQAVKKHGDNGKIRFTVANWLYQRGKIAEAKNQALEAKRNGFANITVELFLAIVARSEKRYGDAITILEKLRLENPTNLQVSNQLALVLIEDEKDKTKQKRALDLAKINFKLFPKNVKTITTLGWVSFKLGDVNSAEKLLTAIVKQNGTTAEIAYYMAHVTFKQNRLQQAKEWLKVANKAKQYFIYQEDAEKWLKKLNEAPE